ncbi:NaeI family type II restriction endonuclease [Streptomyces sp. NPDC048659]|uniref:NaeI family type II restriction endonuclease n=1 Tax=Streptomyces sp. NPDC048659 TaxID=3155489 RepID=UPI00342653AB
MPDPLPGLLAALRSAVPDLDGTALAEALWLAAHTAGDRTAAADRPARTPPADRPARPSGTPDGPPRPDAPAPRPDGPDPAAGPPPAPGSRPLHERLTGGDTRVRGHAVAAPRATGLPRSLELTRALRPWMRRWPRGRRSALDVDATVEGYARSGELIPVLAAAPERWFDLALVVDRSPGMRVWHDTVAEFTGVLDRLGAFRTLLVTDLAFDAAGEPLVPRRLRSADGRRLVVVVSDCMAGAWRRPEVWHLLREWAGVTPTAILNPLPTRLWRRGGLNLPTGRFLPVAPGAHRSRGPVEPPSLLGPPGPPGPPTAPASAAWLPVPVLSLTPHSLGRWSQALMRGAPEGCTAVLVPPTGRLPGAARPAASPLPPEVLAANLLRTASPRAARLAVLCSPFDRLSLRLLHLLREQLVPEAGIADIAEVVTSGVFETEEDAAGGVELVLPPAAQSVLRERLPAHELWAVHQELDRYVAEHGPGPGRLPSVAGDGTGPRDWAAEKEAFARASRRTLELLGFAEPEGSGATEGGAGAEGAHGPGRPHEPDGPPAPDAFVGHTELVEHAVRDLADGTVRVLRVTARDGVPGAGRTAFARQVAHRLRPDFPDGVVLVPMRGSTPHPLPVEAALHRMLRGAGVAEEDIPDVRPADGVRSLVEALRTALEGKRVLLVLDDLGGGQDLPRPLADPPPGCAVLVTSRDQPKDPDSGAGGYGGYGSLRLPPLQGRDAADVLAAAMGPYASPDRAAELVGGGDWWPLSLRLLGGVLATAADTDFALRGFPGYRVTGEHALDPVRLIRDLLETDRVSGGRTWGAMARLAGVGTGEFTRQEAEAALDGTPAGTARLLDALLRSALLERTGPERYAFPGAVHVEVEREAPADPDPGRAAARERVTRLHRAAAAALREDRHPGSALPALLGVTPAPVPHPEVWIPNALVPARPGAAGPDADTLLLLHETGAALTYRAGFTYAARSLVDRRSLLTDEAWVRAVVALAHAQYAARRPREAWDTLHKASSFQLQGDAATYGPAALLLARLSLGGGSETTGAAVSWAEEALAYLDVGATARSPETADALRCLEQALAEARDYAELGAVQRRLARHLADRGLPDEEGRVLVRLADTLLFLDRPAEAAAPARRALALLEAAGDEEGARTARRLLDGATAPEHPTPDRLFVALSGAEPERLAAAALGVLADLALDRRQVHTTAGHVLLLLDTAAPAHQVLRELAERLPPRLDGAVPRIAAHTGPARSGADDPFPGLGAEYARSMLHSVEFARLSAQHPDDVTLCVSPEVFDLLRDTDFPRGFGQDVVRTGNGDEVCVILTPRLDLTAIDGELIALGLVFNEHDPEGRHLAGLLREALDALPETPVTGRPVTTGPGRVERWLPPRLTRSLPFVQDRTAPSPPGGLRWPRPQGDLPFGVRFSFRRDWRGFRPENAGGVFLLVGADDARARWSAGLLRLRPEHLAPGDPQTGLVLTQEALRGAVLWLHREAPLPENVLLGLDPETRDGILAEPDDVARTAALFRSVTRRRVAASTLRAFVRAKEEDRTVRLAGGALREEGLLLLRGNPRGRETARTLRLPVPEPDEYVCVALTRRRSEHGSRPSVVADGAAWVVALDDDELVPLPSGFPNLRSR